MISFDIAKSLDGSAAGLNLALKSRIDQGSLVALFGSSGAGKTSVLRMLSGLMAPDQGLIEVGGECWFDSQRGINLAPQRRSIGFVFQDTALFPNMTVRENIAYGVSSGETQWIEELLALTELHALQARRPARLSGGQKQRVAIARALARKPKLLLLDEPLSALDASARSRLQDVIAHAHERLGMTTLLVSHDVSEVFRLAIRVLHLDGGRIIADAPPEQLFLPASSGDTLRLRAQVLAVRPTPTGCVLSLLIGQQIVEVETGAGNDSASQWRPGDVVLLSSPHFQPTLSRAG